MGRFSPPRRRSRWKMMMGMAARETMDARWSAVMRRGTRARERVVFFVCVVRSVVRRGGGTGRGRVATRAAFRRRPREISSRPSAGNAMMGTMTRAMDDDEDDED